MIMWDPQRSEPVRFNFQSLEKLTKEINTTQVDFSAPRGYYDYVFTLYIHVGMFVITT